MLLKLFPCQVIGLSILLGVLVLLIQNSDLILELPSDVLIDVIIVLTEGFQGVQDFRFQPEGYSSRAIGQSEDGVTEHLVVLNCEFLLID